VSNYPCRFPQVENDLESHLVRRVPVYRYRRGYVSLGSSKQQWLSEEHLKDIFNGRMRRFGKNSSNCQIRGLIRTV